MSVVAHNRACSSYLLASEQDLFKFYVTSYVFRSIYCDQLWRWLQLYPREQFLIIDSQRLLNQRKAVLEEAVAFLGLQAHDFGADQIEHTLLGGNNFAGKPGDYEAMNPGIRTRLEKFFEPFNEQLFDLIGEKFSW